MNEYSIFEFAENNKLSDRELAKYLGVSAVAVCKWRQGIIPSSKHIKNIFEKTNGLVTPNKIFEQYLKSR